MSLNDFEVIKPLGKGAFASVYQVKRKKDGNIYAMKRVNFGTMNSKERDNALNEVRLLASVQHNNIIGYKESFYDDNSKTLNIIMDFADNGDLDSIIKLHLKNKTNIPENDIWNYLIGTLQGLRALHNANVMHRDLKSANIFLKKGVIKIGDLNVSKLIKRTGMDHTQTGTPYYASPEVWSDKPYDYKCDIWSVGCIIYEMCSLKPPFRAQSLEDLFKAITKGKYDPLPNIYSSDLQSMIAQMLQVNPVMRPDVHKLLSNPVVLKKMDYSSCVESSNNKEKSNLLQTIKVPKNMKEINMQLPKKKNYDIGEVIIERKNSEENLPKPKIIDRDLSKPSYLINNVNYNLGDKSNINNPNLRENNIQGPRYVNPVNAGPTINRPTNINVQDIRRSNDYNQKVNNNNNNVVNSNISKEPNNNHPNPIKTNQPPTSIVNRDVKDISKVQDQRAELIKKYNNPILNDNRQQQQDVRVRPRTPDAIPKNNVIMKDNRSIQPSNILNNNNNNNNKYGNVNVINPNNVINRNNAPLNNPYLIKR
jgi:NIMA (never in mitosis gene a)-related kinase